MLLIVTLAATKILPIAIAAVAGVVLMIFTGCMTLRDALRALDPSMIFLTVASLALSIALMKTGSGVPRTSFRRRQRGNVSAVDHERSRAADGCVRERRVQHLGGRDRHADRGVDRNAARRRAEPFVLAVLFGVNFAFCTPMADNCNLLVLNAGGYRFMDFVRVGVPLTLIMWLATTLVLPVFFPLSG